jgi:hypothetical protein
MQHFGHLQAARELGGQVVPDLAKLTQESYLLAAEAWL